MTFFNPGEREVEAGTADRAEGALVTGFAVENNGQLSKAN